MIPTWLSNPTAYLPKFSPLCAPDKALNPISLALIFHFPSFTSIQCPNIPRNPCFVLSTVHVSSVIDIFPGAAYSCKLSVHVKTCAIEHYLQLSLPLAPLYKLQTGYGDKLLHHKNLEGRAWLILVSLRQVSCERQGYQQEPRATGKS